MTIIITKTKLALGILAMVLVGATVVAAGDNDNPFTDVPDVGAGDEAFYSAPVEWLWDNSLTTGSPAGSNTFKPLDNVTRGEYATFNFRYDSNVVQPALEALQTELDAAEADVDDLETNVATVASDVNNATRVYFARVASDGTVEKTSNQVISVDRNSTGSYTATLPEDAQNCAIETSLYASASSDDLSYLFQNLEYANEAFVWAIHDNDSDQPDEEVEVFTYTQDGTDPDVIGVAADMPFTITAYCSDPVFFFDPGLLIPPIITLGE